MKIQKISAKSDFNALCAKLKVHKMGKKIMSEKKELHFFLIKEISLAAINILKQDALSCGAEVLSPENAILGGKELSTAVLIANEKQLKSLEKKEALQDFGLKELPCVLVGSSHGAYIANLAAKIAPKYKNLSKARNNGRAKYHR